MYFEKNNKTKRAKKFVDTFFSNSFIFIKNTKFFI